MNGNLVFTDRELGYEGILLGTIEILDNNIFADYVMLCIALCVKEQYDWTNMNSDYFASVPSNTIPKATWTHTTSNNVNFTSFLNSKIEWHK